MPTYISLISWTEKGIANYKDTLDRANAASDAAAALGGTLKDIYWTIGPYDVVSVAEFPDDETATAFLLSSARREASGRRRCARSMATRWRACSTRPAEPPAERERPRFRGLSRSTPRRGQTVAPALVLMPSVVPIRISPKCVDLCSI
jgi:uncharacterized protein with GYD domain